MSYWYVFWNWLGTAFPAIWQPFSIYKYSYFISENFYWITILCISSIIFSSYSCIRIMHMLDYLCLPSILLTSLILFTFLFISFTFSWLLSWFSSIVLIFSVHSIFSLTVCNLVISDIFKFYFIIFLNCLLLSVSSLSINVQTF